jgi:hypothetical protein
MSQLSRAIMAAVAVSLTFGAVQFALGRDLNGIGQSVADPSQSAINRTAKSDRAVRASTPGVQMQTISLKLAGMADTSFLVRVPVAQAARDGAAAPSWTRSGNGKRVVACEPVVSVLTEIARQLQPGRCVT